MSVTRAGEAEGYQHRPTVAPENEMQVQGRRLRDRIFKPAQWKAWETKWTYHKEQR